MADNSIDIIRMAVQRLESRRDEDIDLIRSAVRKQVTGVVTNLTDITAASQHTDDELLDLAISAAGEYAAMSDKFGVYGRVLKELDTAGCERPRSYHILARLADEVDSMLERNDAERAADGEEPAD